MATASSGTQIAHSRCEKSSQVLPSRTENIRNTDSLFINVSPPRVGNKMSPSAISAALRSCIKEAYVTLDMTPPSGITGALHKKCSDVRHIRESGFGERDLQSGSLVIYANLCPPLQDQPT